MKTKYIILADTTVVAAEDILLIRSWGYETPNANYPFVSGITGFIEINETQLPRDFSAGAFDYIGNVFVKKNFPVLLPEAPGEVPNADLRSILETMTVVLPEIGEVSAVEAVDITIRQQMEQVKDLPASHPTRQAIRVLFQRWEFGNFMQRDSQAVATLFQGLAQAMGESDWESLRDNCFREASKL